MARNNFGAVLGATMADLLTAAAGVDTIVYPPQVTMNPGEVSGTVVDLDWTDSSNADAARNLASDVPVEPGDPASPLRVPLLLKPGDKFRGRAGAAGVSTLTSWFEELEQ